MDAIEWIFHDPIDARLDDVINRVQNLDEGGYLKFIQRFREELLDTESSWNYTFLQLFGEVVVAPDDDRIKRLDDVPLMGAPIPKEVFIAVARSYWELLRRHDEPFPLDGVKLE